MIGIKRPAALSPRRPSGVKPLVVYRAGAFLTSVHLRRLRDDSDLGSPARTRAVSAAAPEYPALERAIGRLDALLAARGEGGARERFDTHISAIIVTDDHAYKFKKPVDFGFVDFTTLARREYFCAQEVMLNGRFAPALYEGVETITDDNGEVLDYAVRMRRFDSRATLDHLVPAGAIDALAIAAFADGLARIHAGLEPVAAGDPLGSAATAGAQILATLEAPLAAHLDAALAARVRETCARLQPRLAVRQAEGHVRDCHGDLHLSNLVRHDGRLLAFDCIEFNDALRVIDTLADAAFLLMDLDKYGAHELGHVFFNAYLEASGDYDGLDLLPLYLAYRSLIRAKVALLAEDSDAATRATAHVALARRYLLPPGEPGLVVTHGLSGSGKSHAARRLAAGSGFLHLRSDVERRRLAGLAPGAASGSRLGSGLYTRAASAQTYARLHDLARRALRAGFSVVVDAACLLRAERAPFFALAHELGVPCHLLWCEAPLTELERRIEARRAAADDPSEATLEV
ncbi:MAG: AAA family ATPase, partial [Gammaproteobacteria bacterium]